MESILSNMPILHPTGKDGTMWSCTACITAIPQRLYFEPGYVLEVGPTSSLKLVPVL